MKARLAFVLAPIVLSICCESDARSAIEAAPSGASVERFMESSGLSRQVSRLEALAIGLLEPNLGAEALEHARDIYAGDQLVGAVRSRLEASLGQSIVISALDWLDSPIGKRVTQLEVTATDRAPETLQTRQNAEDSPQRIDLARRLEVAIDSGRILADVSVSILQIQGGETGMAVAQQEDLRAAYADLSIRSYLSTYESLTIEELESYVQFAESPSGLEYHRHVGDAIVQVMNQAAQDLRERLESLE